MRSFVVAASLALAACHGELLLAGGSDDGTGDDASIGPDADPAVAARAKFDADVAPLLTATCASCHDNADVDGFMNPNPDVYTTVMAWPGLIDPHAPSASRILTKKAHEGPAWTSDQAQTILDWIDLEAAAVGPGDVVATQLITPVAGLNTIPLDDIGLVGASVSFSAEKLSQGLYLSQLSVTASADGAHLVHPLFVTWSGDVPDVDPVDSFDTVELEIPPSTSQTIGGGLIMLVAVPTDAKLSVSFSLAEGYQGGDTAPTGGCKAIPAFTTNAKPPLAGSCVSCHGGGNGGATGATDMTKLDDTSPAGQASACGQILSRINLADPANSGLFITVDPNGGANHPFKFGSANAFTTFKNAVTTWITAEKAAGP